MELLVGLGFDRILIDFFLCCCVTRTVFPVYVVSIKSVPEIETAIVVFVVLDFLRSVRLANNVLKLEFFSFSYQIFRKFDG